jgi:DNA polymerase III epsilon subunit-like protein
MKILVFDTETTGLPKTKELSYDTLNKWPYIVQFSYLIYNTDKHQLVKVRDHIMKLPENVQIPFESTQIHGITNEMSKKEGIIFETIVEEVYTDFTTADLIVAHNLSFDLNLLQAEIMRHNVKIYLQLPSQTNQVKTRATIKREKQFSNLFHFLKTTANYYCTMQQSVDLCNLKKTNSMGDYIKFPKLSELHFTLFQVEPKHLHNSLNDILICLRCFCQMKYQYDVLEKNTTIKKRLSILLD